MWSVQLPCPLSTSFSLCFQSPYCLIGVGSGVLSNIVKQESSLIFVAGQVLSLRSHQAYMPLRARICDSKQLLNNHQHHAPAYLPLGSIASRAPSFQVSVLTLTSTEACSLWQHRSFVS